MDKLQYDSFYIFLVSLGAALIASPFIGLGYLFNNGNEIILSQAEFNALTVASSQFVTTRDIIVLFVMYFFPWLFIGMFFMGIVLLIMGALKWYGIQKELDKQVKLKTQALQNSVNKASHTEVIKSVAKEIRNEEINKNNTPSEASSEIPHIIRALEIRDLCYEYIDKKYHKKYIINREIKLEKTNYIVDAIAVSKKSINDIIFEIKYWDSVKPTMLLADVVNQIRAYKYIYESTSGRNCKCVLMIMTSPDLKAEMQTKYGKYLSINSELFEICVVTENELKLAEKKRKNTEEIQNK